jgi:hypothetical protein
MKKQMPILMLFLIWTSTLGLSAPTITFVHAGAMRYASDLEYAKLKIAEHEQPWHSKFINLIALLVRPYSKSNSNSWQTNQCL